MAGSGVPNVGAHECLHGFAVALAEESAHIGVLLDEPVLVLAAADGEQG